MRSKLGIDRFFLLIILLSFFLHLVLAVLPGLTLDTNYWFNWSERLQKVGFHNFYTQTERTDYMPGYLYILYILGIIKKILYLNTNSYLYLLKLPGIFSEILLGSVVYLLLLRHKGLRVARFGLLSISLNPALIFNSAVWGQVDSILTLFMLLAVTTLKRERLVFSSLFFGMAVLIKPQAIALLPLFALFTMNHFSLQNLFKLLVPGVLIIFILTFPFFPNQTLITLAQHVLNTANQYPYTSLNAYNLWGIFGFWINDNTVWHNLSYQAWGYTLLIIYWIILGFFYLKKKLSLFAVSALATMAFFFLPTRVHERYLYPTLVFLIPTAVYLKSKTLLWLTSALSLLHLLNLYYVYIYYNQSYLKLPEVIYSPTIYIFLENNSKGFSLISTIFFILISICIIKPNGAIYKKT